jgi:hypothetical protein
MPNHVSSNLTITGPADDVRRFVTAVDRSADVDGKPFDFNGVLPMPKELVGTTSPTSIQTQAEIDTLWAEWQKKKDSKCDAGPMGLHSYEQDAPFGLGITQAASDDLIAKYGSNNWYEWAHRNWGTKWGAYDATEWIVTDCSTSGMTTATIAYNTAWSPATPFFERVSLMYPTLVFDTEYADEGGNFVGATSFENGEISDYDYEWNSQEGIAVRESVGYAPDEDEDLDEDDDLDESETATA